MIVRRLACLRNEGRSVYGRARADLKTLTEKGQPLTEPSATFLLFGATGDLAHRMIFPSLYNLLADGLLPDDFMIVASGRSEFTDE